jgi:phage baseplate assembly protein W
MADLLTNFDLSTGYCKCHSMLDFAVSPTGDLSLTKNNQQAMRQRFLLYLATPKGERLQKDVGSCLHDFIHEINSPRITRKLELYIESDLRTQFSELEVKTVRCSPSTYLDGEMEINVIFGDDSLEFLFTPDDLMNLSSMLAEIMYYTT